MQTPIDYTEGQYVHIKHSKSALFLHAKFRKVCEKYHTPQKSPQISQCFLFL